MRVVFFKASRGAIADKLIAWWTSPFKDKFTTRWYRTYSHVELLFSDDMMFSSFQGEGVRFKRYRTTQTNFDVLEIDVDEDKLRLSCSKYLGKEYDYVGLLGFLFGVSDDSDKWFCSEIVATMLKDVGVAEELNPQLTSPNSLYRYLTKEK